MPYFWGRYTIFSVEIPWFLPTFMPYGPPSYGIFWGHIFCKYGWWGWSELFSNHTRGTFKGSGDSAQLCFFLCLFVCGLQVSMLAYAHARCLEWHLRHEGEEKLIDLFSRILSERQLQEWDFRVARLQNEIAPEQKEKQYGKLFKGFGWCTRTMITVHQRGKNAKNVGLQIFRIFIKEHK